MDLSTWKFSPLVPTFSCPNNIITATTKIISNLSIFFKNFTILSQIACLLEDDKINYLHHGDINSTFCDTKECAMSRRYAIMICGCPFLSNILSFIWGSSLLSHTRFLVAVKSCMYSVQNPKTSFSAYHLAMLPSNLALFHTNHFKVSKYLSIGYIQCKWTRPHNSNSSTKWIKRCVMMSKKEGGNSCSNRTKHITTSFFNSPIVVRSIIFTQSFSKTWHKWIIDIWHPFDMKPQRHKGKMSYIRTWKSCDFIPFKSPSLWSLFFKKDT